MFSLDERLSLCASFVRHGSKLADIGTDHAYLPIWLIENNLIESAVAADVRTGPLENARNNIIRYGAADKIKTVLSDGFKNIRSTDAEDIVMAGMGGELIVKLIDCTPWIFDKHKRLILQPMTRSNTLRRYLFEKGFDIIDEKACISLGKAYSVMCCEYDGIIREPSLEAEYIGCLGGNTDNVSKRYISNVKHKLEFRIRGIDKGSKLYGEMSELIKKLNDYTGE